MNVPSFTAEAALYNAAPWVGITAGRTPEGVAFPQASASGLSAGAGRARLGFTCGPFGCVCNDAFDCYDMLSTNVCGPYRFCSTVQGKVVCVCLR